MTAVAPTTTTAAADELLRAALTSPEGRLDPYPFYRGIREIAPLYRSGLDGLWYASRYEDCRALLVDPRCGRRREGIVRRFGMSEAQVQRFNRRQRSTMLMQNPPEHTRLRGMVSRAFTPKRVEGLRERIGELADPLLDAMAEAGEADVMADLAFPLPVSVIGELVGVPEGDREPFRTYVRDSMASGEAAASPEVLEAGERADQFFDSYFAELVARRRAEPADDLLSALIEVRESGRAEDPLSNAERAQDPRRAGSLSEEELLATAVLLFIAGFVTTTNLIGNGLLALLRAPSQFERLWGDPSLVASAVEEMLRWDSPVQINGRTAFERIELGGQVIEEGETVMTLLGGANRDPARFAGPEHLDVGRADNAPLSFGWGIHHCLGAPLARLEAQVVFARMIERFASIELADENPPWGASSLLRGLDALPVRVKAR